jgi:hypothetical protein
MQYFKNILTVFLLAAFSIPLLSPVALQVKQLYVQWQMLEALEKQELVQIKIKTSDIQWIKAKKECWINGEMFDVKQMKIINDETLLTGLYDKKEKDIKNILEERAKDQQKSGKAKQLAKRYSALKHIFYNIELPNGVYCSKKILLKVSTPIYKLPFIGINTPPPKYS